MLVAGVTRGGLEGVLLGTGSPCASAPRVWNPTEAPQRLCLLACR